MEDYEKQADELEQGAREMEKRHSDLGGEIDEAQSEWEQKKGDTAIPGAQPPEGARPGVDEDESAGDGDSSGDEEDEGDSSGDEDDEGSGRGADDAEEDESA